MYYFTEVFNLLKLYIVYTCLVKCILYITYPSNLNWFLINLNILPIKFNYTLYLKLKVALNILLNDLQFESIFFISWGHNNKHFEKNSYF